MSLFKEVLTTIEKNKKDIEKGVKNYIPLPFPRLKKFIPGIMRGVQYLISANSGILSETTPIG